MEWYKNLGGDIGIVEYKTSAAGRLIKRYSIYGPGNLTVI